jgi:Flp pilus assembly protein TadG
VKVHSRNSLAKPVLRSIQRLRSAREKGSAAVEFVVLAIPLFLPILIFLGQFSNVSRSEIQARNLVREVVRAFVSSSDNAQAESNAEAIFRLGQEKFSFTQDEISSMKLSLTCSGRPCLSPGEKVRAEINLTPSGTSRNVRVSAQEFVSPWQ